MAVYRKKPVEIEAVEIVGVDADEDGFQEVVVQNTNGSEEWLRAAMEKGIGEVGGIWVMHGTVCVGTLEGTMRANPGDFLIRGVAGELYPCKKDIFYKTYDQVYHEVEK